MARTSQLVEVGKRKLELSNLEKILFPEDEVLKAEVIQYYLSIAPTILNHIKGRPLSLVRFPDGIMFQRQTGAWIEVFLLDPVSPSHEVARAMLAKGECTWKCMIGNLKKWKDNEVLDNYIDLHDRKILVKARMTSRSQMEVQLSWSDPSLTFSEILEGLGKIPLPPYVTRELEEADSERYQTVYSRNEGAVAAPTAGLHFTAAILRYLDSKNILTDFLTLHVSSGTFQPIKVTDASQHPMHSEQIVVSRKNIETMLESEFIIAVGTTSMRTMESIYWYGVQLESNAYEPFHIRKNTPYRRTEKIPLEKSLLNVLSRMDKLGTDIVHGVTEIFIVPGYSFQTCQGLITNFHIPGSTLMLLVAAFIGNDWKTVYEKALGNNYRFLSFGDSSILFH